MGRIPHISCSEIIDIRYWIGHLISVIVILLNGNIITSNIAVYLPDLPALFIEGKNKKKSALKVKPFLSVHKLVNV